MRVVLLWRGLNVGRANRIAMSDLRQLLLDLSFLDVTTVLNSGTAVARPPTDSRDVPGLVRKALADRLGIDTPLVMRTEAEFTAAATDPPLLELCDDPSRYLVGYLGGDPAPAGVSQLHDVFCGPSRIAFRGRELFLWLPGGVMASPLAAPSWALPLEADVTTRNWATVTKILGVLATG